MTKLFAVSFLILFASGSIFAQGVTTYAYFPFGDEKNPVTDVRPETQTAIFNFLRARALGKKNELVTNQFDAANNRAKAHRYLAISPLVTIGNTEEYNHNRAEAYLADQTEWRGYEQGSATRQAGYDINDQLYQRTAGKSGPLNAGATIVGSVVQGVFDKKADQITAGAIARADQMRWTRRTTTVTVEVKFTDVNKLNFNESFTVPLAATYYIDELYDNGQFKGRVFRRYEEPVGVGRPMRGMNGFDEVVEDCVKTQISNIDKPVKGGGR